MLRLDERRLLNALDEVDGIGAIEGGGCARLALTDDDKVGRDLVVGWMKALHLDVRIDAIGNVIGLRAGREDLPRVMTGGHIDTVRTGRRAGRPRWHSSPTKKARASSPTCWAAWSMLAGWG